MKADGLDSYPLPMTFPPTASTRMPATSSGTCPKATESQEGRWASGPRPDGQGEFTLPRRPEAAGAGPVLAAPDARLYDLPPAMSIGHAQGDGASGNGLLHKAAVVVKEVLTS